MRAFPWVVAFGVLTGCVTEQDLGLPLDAERPAVELGPGLDHGRPDGAPPEPDLGEPDQALQDAGRADSAPTDLAPPVDRALPDLAAPDVGGPDVSPPDAGLPDVGRPDAQPLDQDGDGAADADDCAPADPARFPGAAEACNRLDDDCDGVVDEGEQNACGGCGAVPAEVCDEVDNDCDGRTDEGVQNACGRCGAAPAEVCDEADNDCDGETDEGVANRCGRCGAVPAEVCDGLDQDCDGQIDEGTGGGGCEVEGHACAGQVRCQDGALVCEALGPAPEACSGVDEDCDGRVDEGFAPDCAPCPAAQAPQPFEVHPADLLDAQYVPLNGAVVVAGRRGGRAWLRKVSVSGEVMAQADLGRDDDPVVRLVLSRAFGGLVLLVVYDGVDEQAELMRLDEALQPVWRVGERATESAAVVGGADFVEVTNFPGSARYGAAGERLAQPATPLAPGVDDNPPYGGLRYWQRAVQDGVWLGMVYRLRQGRAETQSVWARHISLAGVGGPLRRSHGRHPGVPALAGVATGLTAESQQVIAPERCAWPLPRRRWAALDPWALTPELVTLADGLAWVDGRGLSPDDGRVVQHALDYPAGQVVPVAPGRAVVIHDGRGVAAQWPPCAEVCGALPRGCDANACSAQSSWGRPGGFDLHAAGHGPDWVAPQNPSCPAELDECNRVTVRTIGARAEAYVYDEGGRLVEERRRVSPRAQRVWRHTYDERGLRTQTEFERTCAAGCDPAAAGPLGVTRILYEHDGAGRLVEEVVREELEAGLARERRSTFEWSEDGLAVLERRDTDQDGAPDLVRRHSAAPATGFVDDPFEVCPPGVVWRRPGGFWRRTQGQLPTARPDFSGGFCGPAVRDGCGRAIRHGIHHGFDPDGSCRQLPRVDNYTHRYASYDAHGNLTAFGREGFIHHQQEESEWWTHEYDADGRRVFSGYPERENPSECFHYENDGLGRLVRELYTINYDPEAPCDDPESNSRGDWRVSTFEYGEGQVIERIDLGVDGEVDDVLVHPWFVE